MSAMRWFHFLLIQLFLIIVVAGVVYIHRDSVSIIKIPPASIANWYKPVNKRQVWLHNMFKLRRELQAVTYYSSIDDIQHLEKWTDAFTEHYLKIAEMMPQWKKKLNIEGLHNLQRAAKTNEGVQEAVDKLNHSCKTCHADYKTTTAAIYRTADFSVLGDISPSVSVKKHMLDLTEQINQIKIASEDGIPDTAKKSLLVLDKGIRLLGETCVSCHEHDPQVYPGVEIEQTLASLESSLTSGTLKQQGRHLGTLAVIACARCHGTHRLSTDAKALITQDRSWLELIRHGR